MAKYRITAPDGKQYLIEGNGTQEEALAHFQAQYAQQQQQEPQEPKPFSGPLQEQADPPITAMQQIGNSAANLYRGAAAVPNMFLDIPANLHNVLAPKSPPWRTQTQMQNEGLKSLGVREDTTPTGQVIGAINRGVGGALGGLGMGGALAGSASPTVAAVGQGMATQPMTQIASGATGAASGDIARQMGAGPIGQTVAGLAGGAVPALASGAIQAMRNKPEPFFGSEDMKVAAKEAYAKADSSGATIPAEDFRAMAKDVGDSLKSGFHPKLTPRAAVSLEEMRSILDSGEPVTLDQAMNLRGVIRLASASPDANERRLGQIMTDKLDDLVAGSTALPEQARNFYRRAMNAEMVDKLVQKAEDSSSQFGGSGLENAIRTQFRQFVKNDRKMRLLSDDQQDAMRRVAQGTTAGNLARFLGRFAPRGPVSVGADYFMGGSGAGALATALAGEGGRQMATASTARNVALAKQLMLQSAMKPKPPIDWPMYGGLAGAVQGK